MIHQTKGNRLQPNSKINSWLHPREDYSQCEENHISIWENKTKINLETIIRVIRWEIVKNFPKLRVAFLASVTRGLDNIRATKSIQRPTSMCNSPNEEEWLSFAISFVYRWDSVKRRENTAINHNFLQFSSRFSCSEKMKNDKNFSGGKSDFIGTKIIIKTSAHTWVNLIYLFDELIDFSVVEAKKSMLTFIWNNSDVWMIESDFWDDGWGEGGIGEIWEKIR
jgi:hypothetical protein